MLRSPVCRAILFVVLILLEGRRAHAQIHTHHDNFPNFCGTPTLASVRAGDWSDAGTWGGRLPGANDIVRISPGTAVVYDRHSDVAIKSVCVENGAVLSYRTDLNTRLVVTNFLVQEGGALRIGSPSSPVPPHVTAEMIFPDTPLDLAADPLQWGNGLLVLGEITVSGHPRTPTFVRMARELKEGDVDVVLERAVGGWQIGDEVIVPDSTQHWRVNPPQEPYTMRIERFTVAAISPDGTTVRLSSAARFLHPGARNRHNEIVFLPHLLNASRNVIFRSANPNGVRGHTAWTHQAAVDVRYASFIGLGRTLNKQLDNTVIDANGQVTHVGTNQIGKYGVHFHHLLRPNSLLLGCYIDGQSVDPEGPRSGVWVHSSYGVTVQDNVGAFTTGWTFGTEKGNEKWVTFKRNFALHNTGIFRRPDGAGDEPGSIGAAFWLRGPLVTFAENVAANSVEGFNIFLDCCPPNRVPTQLGADPNVDGQWETFVMNASDFFVDGFEVYSTNKATEHWYITTHQCKADGTVARSRYQDLNLWHVADLGLQYPSGNVEMTRVRAYADPTRNDSLGYTLGDYRPPGFVLRDSTFEGFGGTAFSLGTDSGGGIQKILNSSFYNSHDVDIPPQITSGSPFHMPPQRVVLENVTLDTSPQSRWDDIPTALTMGAMFTWGVNNMVLAQTHLRNVSINGRTLNTSAYRPAAHPQFIVPGSMYGGPGMVGAPTLGLNNEQLFNQFQTAIGGAVAPCQTMLPHTYAMFCDPLPGSLEVISWGISLQPNPDGTFKVFLGLITNEPSELKVTVDEALVAHSPPAFVHDVSLGDYPAGIAQKGFRAIAESNGRTASPRWDLSAFWTPQGNDATAPTIGELLYAKNSHSSTSELFTMSTSESVWLDIYYGLTPALGTLGYRAARLGGGGYSWLQGELKNLTPDTEYFAQVVIRDAAGNETRSNILQFRTARTPVGAAPVAANHTVSTDRNRCLAGAVPPGSGQNITYKLHSVPLNGSVQLAPDGGFTYVPLPDSSGQDSFTYVAEDEFGRLSAPATVSVNVQSTGGTAPTIGPIADQTIRRGDHLTVPVQAQNGAAGGSLTFFLSGDLPATMNPSTSTLDIWAPATQPLGSYVMAVIARNSVGEESSRSFTVTVLNQDGSPGPGPGPNPGGPGAPDDGKFLVATAPTQLSVPLKRGKAKVKLVSVIAYLPRSLHTEGTRKILGLLAMTQGPAKARISSGKVSISLGKRAPKKDAPKAKRLSSSVTFKQPGSYSFAFVAIAGARVKVVPIQVTVTP